MASLLRYKVTIIAESEKRADEICVVKYKVLARTKEDAESKAVALFHIDNPRYCKQIGIMEAVLTD